MIVRIRNKPPSAFAEEDFLFPPVRGGFPPPPSELLSGCFAAAVLFEGEAEASFPYPEEGDLFADVTAVAVSAAAALIGIAMVLPRSGSADELFLRPPEESNEPLPDDAGEMIVVFVRFFFESDASG
ncbi:MAG: hypothetical protein IKS32_03300 [Solobacterium sp.]|nr:hypothetical protein [Solobacterium sp.]